MSSIFGGGAKAPDPNALPAAVSQDASLLKPGADADLDPQAQLAKDQVTANALSAARGTQRVALAAPYLVRARDNEAMRAAAAGQKKRDASAEEIAARSNAMGA